MSNDSGLAGRTAVVTGGGSGIGRACAEMLAAEGARVVVADRDKAAATDVVDALVVGGASAEALVLDVAQWTECAAALTGIGDVDVLVNCAATWTVGPFVQSDPAGWRPDLDVTLLGTLHATRAVLPGMIERRRGSIVNVGSEAGRIGEPYQVVYAAAKAGVIGMTKALALEVGAAGVRVNCVTPGLTRTPGSAEFIASAGEDRLSRRYPLGRIGEPEDVAAAVVFLSSERSGWVTGQVLAVNGGYATGG
jgi:NAD(P)-dependent dehydrogenase (short-subunit alcohol dehydrogenase family)